MKANKMGVALICSILFWQCNQAKKEASLKNHMIGKWQTTYLKIDFNTYNSSDSTFVMEDKFDNNPERIAQSEYYEDGTFKAWFLDRNKSQQGLTSGKWSASNDTLFTSYFYLGKDVKALYKVLKIDNGFKATSKYDWDNDGEQDDLLIMKTKRIE